MAAVFSNASTPTAAPVGPQKSRRSIKVQHQIVLGKQFKGTPFLSDPPQVLFEDFEVGVPSSRTITLTNVSWSFNTFKALELPLDISDFFEITYERPGEVSAGMSCQLTIHYSPKVNEDIHSEIRFLAKTGEFSVPLIATTKKVAISVEPALVKGVGRVVDFDSVVVAETATKVITIRNSGALATRFSLLGSITQCPTLQITPDKHEGMYLPPRSVRTLKLVFNPSEVGHIDADGLLHFQSSDVQDIVFSCKGHGTEVPVYVHEGSKTLEFKCCVVGALYRDELVMCNRGKISIKVTPQVPQLLKPFLEYVPKFGFIQPSETLKYQVKFRPSRALLDQIASDGGVINKQISISVLGQALPVSYMFNARLTSTRLKFSDTALDFGNCVIGEGVSRRLVVENTGALPIEVGFPGLPKGIFVTPNCGFGCIHPNRSKEFLVCVTPSGPIVNETLYLTTERDETYPITLTGSASVAPLTLSSSVVKFAATALYDEAYVTVLLKNTSSTSQVFCVDLQGALLPDTPDDTNTPEDEAEERAEEGTVIPSKQELLCMSISPSSGMVAPGEATAVLLKFAPNSKMLKSALWRYNANNSDKSVGLSCIAGQPHRTPTANPHQASWHASLKLPCFITAHDNVPANSALKVIYLEVHLCCTLPTIIAENSRNEVTPSNVLQLLSEPEPPTPEAAPTADPEETEAEKVAVVPVVDVAAVMKEQATRYAEWQEQNCVTCVDFKATPANSTVLRTVVVRNVSWYHSAQLVAVPLDTFGPFQIVKPPTFLSHNHICEVTLKFTPSAPALYQDTLVLQHIGGSSVAIKLIGKGLAPSLEISLDSDPPIEGSVVKVPLGACLTSSALLANGVFNTVDEAKGREMTLTSKTFAVPFRIEFDCDSIEPYNSNGGVPFSAVPECGVVPENGSVKVKLLFAPDHPYASYRASAICAYGGADKDIRLNLSGTACSRSVYAHLPKALNLGGQIARSGTTTVSHPTPSDDSLSWIGAAKPSLPFVYEFFPIFNKDRRLEAEATHTIFFGNIKGNDGKLGTPGEVTVEAKEIADAEACGFKLTGMAGGKLVLPAGAQDIPVEVVFAPKDSTGCLSHEVFSQLPVPGVSIDVEAKLRFQLRGGWPQGEAPQDIVVVLKGSIRLPV